MGSRTIAILAIVALAALFQAPSAFAQSSRTWVSGTGRDDNACTREAPCRSFSGAISKTAAGGEINTLDPGGFGSLAITKSVSIISNHKAGINGFIGPGITVNAPADAEVYLEGLDLEGLGNGTGEGSSPTQNGVRMIGLGKLTIRKSSIRNFTQYCIDIQAQAGASVVIEDVEIAGCNTGVVVNGAGSATNTALIVRSLIHGNAKGVIVADAGNSVKLADNVFANTTDLITSPGAAAVSFGGNVIERGTPTRTTARK